MKIYIVTLDDVESEDGKQHIFVSTSDEGLAKKVKAWVNNSDYDFIDVQEELDACKTIKELQDFFKVAYNYFQINLTTQELE